jgi:hypothetical protein
MPQDRSPALPEMSWPPCDGPASAGITSQQLALQLGFKDKGQRYLLFDAIDATAGRGPD